MSPRGSPSENLRLQLGRPQAAVFIDGAYLGMATRELKDGRRRVWVDYEEMCDELVAPYFRLRTYYYNTLPADEEAAQHVAKFHDSLRLSDRFEVKLGKMKGPYESRKAHQKQVDVLLALDMFRLSTSGKIDVEILISGDGDYVPALQAVKDQGVLTKLVYIAGTGVEDELKLVADTHLEIGEADFRRWQLKRVKG